MTGLASRLNSLVEPTHRTTKPARARKGVKRRRGSYRKGEVALGVGFSVKLTLPLQARLDRVCARLRVARSIIIRDALDAYLRVVERETGVALVWPQGRGMPADE